MTITVRALTITALAVILGGPSASAQEQDLSRYREYALESSLASVVKTSGAREDDAKSLHARPARIQELEWRAPYVMTGSEMADPVRDILFSFYDDQLYQLVVTYDRDRMEGLTDDDVVDSLSGSYGVPVLPHARKAASTDTPDTIVVARWENGASSLMLLRGTYSLEFQLVLTSRMLSTRARSAIKEAISLDAREAPQRELDRQKKEVADVREAHQKARVINKAAFRP